MHKSIVIIFLLGLSSIASATPREISCMARYEVVTTAGLKDVEAKPLPKVFESSTQIQFEGDVKDRTFTLSGNLKDGDFTLSQVWGKDFTEGVRIAGTFNSSGEMKLSTITTVPVSIPESPDVKVGSAVYKLECARASE